jgi:hypothetical protein
MVLTVETAFLTRSAVHRADSGQLGGLVVDEQGRCVLRSDEMVLERVADWGTGHWSGTYRSRDRMRPKLVTVTVSGCHLIPVISCAV